MKLKETFMTTVMDDENVMLDVGGDNFVGIVRNNDTAAFIIECLKKETTAVEITNTVCREYNAPRDVVKPDVEEVLKILRSINALDE